MGMGEVLLWVLTLGRVPARRIGAHRLHLSDSSTGGLFVGLQGRISGPA